MTGEIHIQIVRGSVRGGWETLDITTNHLVHTMARLGYEPDGTKGGDHLRVELRGQPGFKELCGPMWGGHHPETGRPVLRYESWAAYESLSR